MTGGAVYMDGGSFIDWHETVSTFINNTAYSGDGGSLVCSRCTLSLAESIIHHNRAINGRGGCIAAFQPEAFIIKWSTFSDCTSDLHGGAVYHEGALTSSFYEPPQLDMLSFINCSSIKGGGGAIYIGDASSNRTIPRITSCTFNNNNGVYGNDIASIATSLQLRGRSSIRTSYSPAQLIDPISIQLKDMFDQTVSTDSRTVIAVDLTSGILSGSSLQRLSKGIANFTDLRIIGDTGIHTIIWNSMDTLFVEFDVNNTGLCSIGTVSRSGIPPSLSCQQLIETRSLA
jgi:hypothetical protein